MFFDPRVRAEGPIIREWFEIRDLISYRFQMTFTLHIHKKYIHFFASKTKHSTEKDLSQEYLRSFWEVRSTL